jgi:glutaminase
MLANGACWRICSGFTGSDGEGRVRNLAASLVEADESRIGAGREEARWSIGRIQREISYQQQLSRPHGPKILASVEREPNGLLHMHK